MEDERSLLYPGVLISPQPDQEGNKLQRPNSNFCKPLKKFRRLSVQPGLRGSNDLRVARKMATFQLFFLVGWAKDLSAPLYLKGKIQHTSAKNFKSRQLRTTYFSFVMTRTHFFFIFNKIFNLFMALNKVRPVSIFKNYSFGPRTICQPSAREPAEQGPITNKFHIVSATLTEVFPWFFLSCKANTGVKLAKTGHGPYFS